MKSEWKNSVLGDLVEIKYGKDYKSVIDENGNIPIYGTGGVMGYANRSIYNKPSVLIGRKGSISRVKFVDSPFWTVDTLFYTVINELKVLPKFLFYELSLINFDYYNEGTTIPSLRTETLNRLEITLPHLPTQQKIAAILSALDAKIENNNAINRNLEQQAQAIYDKFLGCENNNNVTVGDVVLTANTGADAIQKAPIVDYDTGIRCIRVGDLTNRRAYQHWGYTNVSGEVFQKYKLLKDDIVVTRTAELGLSYFVYENLDAVYNNGLIRIVVDNKKVVPVILYYEFLSNKFRDYIKRINGETSVRPNMKIEYLLAYSFPCKSLTKQKDIAGKLIQIENMKMNIERENTRLAALRDTLLPKLMSGEIEV